MSDTNPEFLNEDVPPKKREFRSLGDEELGKIHKSAELSAELQKKLSILPPGGIQKYLEEAGIISSDEISADREAIKKLERSAAKLGMASLAFRTVNKEQQSTKELDELQAKVESFKANGLLTQEQYNTAIDIGKHDGVSATSPLFMVTKMKAYLESLGIPEISDELRNMRGGKDL